MREIRFRAWDEDEKMMVQWNELRDTQLFNDGFDNDHCVLMQFTGLKDKNGKEIYEGDIVKGKKYTGPVEYYLDGFRIYSDPCSEGLADWGYDEREVIGNVFENEELLHDNK
jgi:uncharacterized phage protein (TIGR01671 family)